MRHDSLIARHTQYADGTALIEITDLPVGRYTADQLRHLARTLKTIAIDSDQGATGERTYEDAEVTSV